jgi:hypothetical protein
MTLLKELVTSYRLVLHTTDITLLEVRRQIRERVLARQRELSTIEKDLARWHKSAPKAAPKRTIEFDAEALSIELFHKFERFLRLECKALVHTAVAVAPAQVFETYFDRKPPFDGEDSKEFPDGFVLEALRQWCREESDRIYVVTRDQPMTRAVLADQRLLPLKDIHELLGRAAAELGAAGESAAETALVAPAFDSTLEGAVRAQMKEIGYVVCWRLGRRRGLRR